MKGYVMQPAIDFASLPEDSRSRAKVLEHRTRPDPNKPKVSKACDAHLAGIEERTAQCYAEIEERTFRLRKLAERIGNTVPSFRPSDRADSEAG
jgi:hypothetical protein